MKLCLSVYLSLLNQCRAVSVSKARMGRTVMACLNPDVDPSYYSDSMISDLSRGKKNIGHAESEYALSCNKADVTQTFSRTMLPLLDETKMRLLITALMAVVRSDDELLPDTCVDLVGGKSKDAFLDASELVLSESLAGLLLFCAAKVSNRGTQLHSKEIDPTFMGFCSNNPTTASLTLNKEDRPHFTTLWAKGPNELRVVQGNLFDFCSNDRNARTVVVIPVDTAFTTVLTTEVEKQAEAQVSEKTIHGQWLRRMQARGIDSAALSGRIQSSLDATFPLIEVSGHNGIGRIAAIDDGGTTFFLVAISAMEHGVARSSEQMVRRALSGLIEHYDRVGQGYPLYLPLIGTGRSRAGLGYRDSLGLIVEEILKEQAHLQGTVNIVVQPSALNPDDIEIVRKRNGL